MIKNMNKLDETFQLEKSFLDENIIPGKICTKNLQLTLSLAKSSEGAWKKAIKQTHESVILGSLTTTTMLNLLF